MFVILRSSAIEEYPGRRAPSAADSDKADRYLRHSRTASGMMRIVMQVHPDEGEMLLEAVRAARAAWRVEEKEKCKKKKEQQQEQQCGGPGGFGTRPEAEVRDDSAESSGRSTSADALLPVAETFLDRA
ncbi:MAG: hypothetical protein ACE5GW_11135, partial [Planctomycetota bacterium]